MCKSTKTPLLIYSLSLLLSVGIAEGQTCNTRMGAATPTSQFINHDNGTVTDKKTGLMWKKCSEGQVWRRIVGKTECPYTGRPYTWQTALARAQTVNRSGGFVGKTDWRVPNIKELASIIETKCADSAINEQVFPHTSYMAAWSSSVDAANNNMAWAVSFSKGYDSPYNKTSQYLLRLVRGGQ